MDIKSIVEKLKGKGPLIISSIAFTLYIITAVSTFTSPSCEAISEDEGTEVSESEERGFFDRLIKEPEFIYGVSKDTVKIISDRVKNGETLSGMLSEFGVNGRMIHEMVTASKKVFDTRSIKSGADYTILLSSEDNTIRHFIYQINSIDYVIYTYGDKISVRKDSKPVKTERKTLFVTITSSLWESIVNAGGSPAIVMGIENIFQWTVDFYTVKKGDSFCFIYDEQSVDGKSIGLKNIVSTSYTPKNGKSKYAIRFENDKVSGYWDENGNSLKRAFLKAPLRFSRISSKFSYKRLHPVYKVYRPHTGVDYAAPSGTPIESVADGVVTSKFYQKGGGGHVLKIKHHIHNGAYTTGYLHLRGYAKGIKVGTRVKQGQIIGYVGSTGASTGPHLDFRVWKHGKPIDPLKISNESGEPLKSDIKKEFLAQSSSLVKQLKEMQKDGEKSLSKEEKKQIELDRRIQELEEEKAQKETLSIGD